jgi:hypothetical protein
MGKDEAVCGQCGKPHPSVGDVRGLVNGQVVELCFLCADANREHTFALMRKVHELRRDYEDATTTGRR